MLRTFTIEPTNKTPWLQLSKLLDFRNDKTHLQSSLATQRSLHISEQLTVQNATISDQVQTDSRTLKALSSIATVYLLASIVVLRTYPSCRLGTQSPPLPTGTKQSTQTFFSNDLVYFPQAGDSGTSCGKGTTSTTDFKVSKEFWIYVLSTTLLTALTLLTLRLLERSWRISKAPLGSS